MARHGSGEIAASGCVLLIAGGFLLYGVGLTSQGGTDGYTFHAVFTSSAGIEVGSRIDLAGIAVGAVRSIRLDQTGFVSDVGLTIRRGVRLPSDSSLSIAGGSGSAGTIEIHPGRSAETLDATSVVHATTSATSLEQQVGDFIFGQGSL